MYCTLLACILYLIVYCVYLNTAMNGCDLGGFRSDVLLGAVSMYSSDSVNLDIFQDSTAFPRKYHNDSTAVGNENTIMEGQQKF